MFVCVLCTVFYVLSFGVINDDNDDDDDIDDIAHCTVLLIGVHYRPPAYFSELEGNPEWLRCDKLDTL